MTMKKDNWKVWDDDKTYGERFFDRITGELPEMESSKAVAKILKKQIYENYNILDVGCGSGHYLKSLLSEIEVPFNYTGVDATNYYIELAKKAWVDCSSASFYTGDIFDLPFDDNSFDVVYCCNVFLHLPSIKKPLEELIRVSKKIVVVRSLFSERSFRIQDVHQKNDDSSYIEFDENGEPVSYHFYNIYSKDYVRSLIPYEIQFNEDNDYEPSAITDEFKLFSTQDQSHIIDGKQVNGCIIQPWQFAQIAL